MLINLIVAAAYFYFNCRYYKLAGAVIGFPRMRWLPTAGAFLLNYALFYWCSIMEFNLLINWGLFFLLLLIETLLYCRQGFRVALFFSLNGILYGLTVNIFCRCAVSAATSMPLAAFDNHVYKIGNLKALPVFLGFLLGGAVLHLMSHTKVTEQFRILIRHPDHLAFQLELMAGMFLYLYLNLLLYQSPGNLALLKLWGIKSCIFSLAGSYLGMRYSLKMCRLSDYREQNRAIRQELARKETEEGRLRYAAYRDALTGTYSRPFILDKLEALLRQRAHFALCFLDLDDLKGVNDRYGHLEGDRYLVTVALELVHACRKDSDLLARYGGDEFLMLLPDTGIADAEARFRQVNLRLGALSASGSGSVPFPMSISFGVVDGDARKADELIRAADRKMYLSKQLKKQS